MLHNLQAYSIDKLVIYLPDIWCSSPHAPHVQAPRKIHSKTTRLDYPQAQPLFGQSASTTPNAKDTIKNLVRAQAQAQAQPQAQVQTQATAAAIASKPPPTPQTIPGTIKVCAAPVYKGKGADDVAAAVVGVVITSPVVETPVPPALDGDDTAL